VLGCCCRFHFGYFLFGALHEVEGIGATTDFSWGRFSLGFVLVQHPSQGDVKVELKGFPLTIECVIREQARRALAVPLRDQIQQVR
jgi:hypothetical protein